MIKISVIVNYNYDHYWMWTKAKSYTEYLGEGHLHSSPEYYTRIFARDSLDIDQAKKNLALFDHVIIAEENMDTLEELGWSEESDTTHPTFGDKKRAAILFVKLRWIRLFNYLKNHEFSHIYLLAGQVAVTTSLLNPRLDFNSNALGCFNVLEAIRKTKKNFNLT